MKDAKKPAKRGDDVRYLVTSLELLHVVEDFISIGTMFIIIHRKNSMSADDPTIVINLNHYVHCLETHCIKVLHQIEVVNVFLVDVACIYYTISVGLIYLVLTVLVHYSTIVDVEKLSIVFSCSKDLV